MHFGSLSLSQGSRICAGRFSGETIAPIDRSAGCPREEVTTRTIGPSPPVAVSTSFPCFWHFSRPDREIPSRDTIGTKAMLTMPRDRFRWRAASRRGAAVSVSPVVSRPNYRSGGWFIKATIYVNVRVHLHTRTAPRRGVRAARARARARVPLDEQDLSAHRGKIGQRRIKVIPLMPLALCPRSMNFNGEEPTFPPPRNSPRSEKSIFSPPPPFPRARKSRDPDTPIARYARLHFSNSVTISRCIGVSLRVANE